MAEAALHVPIERIAPDTIRLERVLDAPVETVWRYLTEAALRQTWFMGGTDIKGTGEFELHIDHDKLSDEPVEAPESYKEYQGATWQEKVIRFDPPRLLETTFQGGKNGKVTYELRQESDGTRLILTHSGIVSPVGAQDFGSGWTSHLAVLQQRLGGGGVPDFWALHARSRDDVRAALES